MSNIVPFSFEGAPVRATSIEGDPWFVLTDACKVLGITNAPDAADRLDADEKATVALNDISPSGIAQKRTFTLVSEGGLYALILRSDKPQAKPFRKWVTGTVLPSIRKNGGYLAGQESSDPAEIMARAVLVAQQVIADRDARLAIVEPKAAALDRLECLAGDLLVTDAAKVLKIGRAKLVAWMVSHGWLYRRTDDGPLVGYQTKTVAGYLTHRVSRFTKPDGSENIKEQVRVTPKGVAKLASVFE